MSLHPVAVLCITADLWILEATLEAWKDTFPRANQGQGVQSCPRGEEHIKACSVLLQSPQPVPALAFGLWQ